MTVGWRNLRLGDVCELKYGKSLPQATRSGSGFSVFGSNGQIGQHDEAITAGPTIVVGRKGSFGEVTFSSDSCWPIDTTYYVDESATDADLRWLYYRMKAMPLTQLNRAAAVPGLNREDAYAQTLLLPPVDEQRRIAAVLDAAEGLRAKRRQALTKLDSMMQAVFVDMFGDAVSGDSGWQLECLADVVAEGTTVTYGIVQAGEEFPGGVPYIRTGDIVDGRIQIDGLRRTDPAIADKFPRSCVRAGEIVMSIRATVGTTAIVPASLDGSNLTQGTARISPGESVDGTYLLEYLRSDVSQRWIQRQVKGATFREITLGRLREMPVLVPPLRLQQEFADTCQQSGQLRTILEESLNQLEGLFASLQQRAFQGEL